MKNSLIILFLLLSLGSLAQMSNEITYLDKYRNKVVDFSNAYLIKKAEKLNDSIWNIKIFKLNGKLFLSWNSKDNEGKQKLGQFLTYNHLDTISSILTYNNDGIKHGPSITWFPNRVKNHEGRYLNGKKEGIWKFYHTNNQLAAKLYYKRDSILKEIYFDELGNPQKFISENNNVCKCSSAKFVGGKKKLNRKLNRLSYKLNYLNTNLIGKIYVEIKIDELGKVVHTSFSTTVSDKIKNVIINFIQDLGTWIPAKHLNRKIYQTVTIPLIFKA